MTAKRKGRPPLPKGEAKSHKIGVSLKPAEYKQLLAITEGSGLTPSEVARSFLVRHLR